MVKSSKILFGEKPTHVVNNSKSVWEDYKVHDCIPWHVCLLTAIQQVLSTISGPLTNIFIMWNHLCAPNNSLVYSELISTTLFLSGISTLLQATIGLRLPIIQSSSSSYLTVVVSSMATPQWRCPDVLNNGTSNGSTVAPDQDYEEAWKPRLLMLSGCLCVASVVELILGCTGAVGFLIRFVGPITVACSVALVGLSLFSSAADAAKHQWGIAMMVVCLIMLFGFVFDQIKVPFPSYRRTTGCYMVSYPVFKLFPHLLATGFAWLLSYILTITDVFPSNPESLQYKARTDIKLNVIDEAAWWFWPYPGRWGWPTLELGTFVGMSAVTLSSIIESIGDYYALAGVCNVPVPPKHAINRGIAIEGFDGVLAGLLSAGHGTTSYSSTVGLIAITGIKPRIVSQCFGVIMLLCGCFGKVGAALSIIPDPIIAGLSIVGFAMIISVGLSNLRHVDVASPRNMAVIGVSIIIGMALPNWIKTNPGIINTGSAEADQLLTVILSTETFVGGMLACVLDNTVPGTLAERGLGNFSSRSSTNAGTADDIISLHMKKTYGLPDACDVLCRFKWCSYLPFLPSYKDEQIKDSYDSGSTSDECSQNYDCLITRL